MTITVTVHLQDGVSEEDIRNVVGALKETIEIETEEDNLPITRVEYAIQTDDKTDDAKRAEAKKINQLKLIASLKI